jgi:hypothetical protein
MIHCSRLLRVVSLVSLVLSGRPAQGQTAAILADPSTFLRPGPADDDQPPSEEQKERTPLGLTIDLGVGSAYGYRGLNLCAESSQQDQQFVVQPSLAYAVRDTGLTITYFSSYQVTGERQAKVDAGSSDEQDLILSFEREIADGASIGASFGAFVYPMARADVAGTPVPVYLEPGLSASWSTVVDLSLAAAFLVGAQDALRSGRYVYVNPKIGKTIELTSILSLSGTLGYGVKAQEATDNMHDVLAEVGVTLSPSELFYVTPAVHWAWTNLEHADFVDEQFAWVSTNVGSSF